MRKDMDNIVMCGSHADKHVANMQDKIGNGYSYNFGRGVANYLGTVKMWNNCMMR